MNIIKSINFSKMVSQSRTIIQFKTYFVSFVFDGDFQIIVWKDNNKTADIYHIQHYNDYKMPNIFYKKIMKKFTDKDTEYNPYSRCIRFSSDCVNIESFVLMINDSNWF